MLVENPKKIIINDKAKPLKLVVEPLFTLTLRDCQ